MAITTSSVKLLIDAFAVMSEKDSITPTTVATVFYRLAGLLADCASDADISTVKNMINSMGDAIANEKTRAMNAEASLTRSINNLKETVTENKNLMLSKTQVLQQNINAVVGDLAKEIVRAKAAEADLSSSITQEKARAKSAEGDLAKDIDWLKTMRISDKNELKEADNDLLTAIDGFLTKLNNEISRATKAESSQSAFSTRMAKALDEEIARAINKESVLERAIDLLKRNLASEQTRAKNAETAIIAYMISIINSQAPNGPDAGTTITVNIEDDPEAIWTILTHAPEKSVYQGVLGELTFTMMHAATENTHILMWPSGDGVNVFTISNIEDEIKTSQSRLSLYD